MFAHVIVGVDGRPGGYDAIALAERLAERPRRVTFAHVYGNDAHNGKSGETATGSSKRERADELLIRARKHSGIDARLIAVPARSPARGLRVLAREREVDLVVVGSSRRRLVGQVLQGDDTHAILDGDPCPVAIAPYGYANRPGAIRKIGLGYNGSTDSEQAVALARRLAARYGAKLSANEVVELRGYALWGWMAAPTEEVIGGIVADAEEQLSALRGIESDVVYGEVAEELARYSASVDLLIIGSRGYGPVRRVVHGNISQRLARSARCPLLIVTRTRRDARLRGAAAQQPTTASPDP